MNVKTILTVFKKDLIDGLKNYHIILMILTPVVLSVLFTRVFTISEVKEEFPNIGVVALIESNLVEFIQASSPAGNNIIFENRAKLEKALIDEKVGLGIVIVDNTDFSNSDKAQKLIIIYPPSIPSFGVESIKSTIESHIRKHIGLEPKPLPFDIKIESVTGQADKSVSMKNNIFPMLILMAIGMIGFLALPMTIVEEREKGTFNAIFLTPITPAEYITGKTLFSFCIGQATIILMLFLSNQWGANPIYLFLFTILGSLMTIFIGLIISVFVNSQGAVNAIGTTLFLFFQMIPNLRQSSELVNQISPYIPSTYIFSGIRKAMFMNLEIVSLRNELLAVLAITLSFYALSFIILKFKKADK